MAAVDQVMVDDLVVLDTQYPQLSVLSLADIERSVDIRPGQNSMAN